MKARHIQIFIELSSVWQSKVRSHSMKTFFVIPWTFFLRLKFIFWVSQSNISHLYSTIYPDDVIWSLLKGIWRQKKSFNF